MYTREEASRIRQRFWTSFGQYMRPVRGAAGDTVNWLNYKTGVKHLFFRMDVDRQQALIAIEWQQRDLSQQQEMYDRFMQMKSILEEETGEEWRWQLQVQDEDGKIVSRVIQTLPGVNIFNEADWPSIISFLKPKMLALDRFWMQARDFFET